MTADQIYNHIDLADEKKVAPVLYEALYGAAVPFYDFDSSYPTEAEQKEAENSDFNDVREAVEAKWGQKKARYLWRSSCGYDAVKKLWKNSYHCLVRGVGYYKQGSDIPLVDGCDKSVYKDEGKRQLFRVLGCSKEGNNRPLKRLEYFDREWRAFGAIEWVTMMDNGIVANEKWEDSFVQYIGTEHLLAPAPKAEVKGEAKRTGPAAPGAYSYVDEKFITAVVDMLKPERANGYDTWAKALWAIRNAGIEYGLDLRPLAHNFSKRTARQL